MKAKDTQVGGSHYHKMPIQVFDYCEANKLSYAESAVVKYISRWRFKNGIEDLKKAKHFIELLIEKYGERTSTMDSSSTTYSIKA